MWPMKDTDDTKPAISARIDRSTRDAINEIAETERRSFSTMVDFLLAEAVFARGQREMASRKKARAR